MVFPRAWPDRTTGTLYLQLKPNADFVYFHMFVDFRLYGKGNAVAGVQFGDFIFLET